MTILSQFFPSLVMDVPLGCEPSISFSRIWFWRMRALKFVSGSGHTFQFSYPYASLQGLIDGIHEVLNKRKEDEELDSELTRVDIIKCVQSEKVRFRGVNLSGLDLSKLVRSHVDLSI